MVITISRILLLVAVIAFVVAWIMTAGAVTGGNPSAWGYAGLSFFAASFLVP